VLNEDFTRRRPIELEVAVPRSLRLTCARCGEVLLVAGVALYTRTLPGDPFEPWCPDCALVLIQWAGLGAATAGDITRAEYLTAWFGSN
jgi:hypothetical protein